MKTSRSDVRRMLSVAVKSTAARCQWYGRGTVAGSVLHAIGGRTLCRLLSYTFAGGCVV